MFCKSLVITGCNRGIGLEIVKQLAESAQSPKHIIAACRKPEAADALQELQTKFNEVISIVKLDVTDESQYSNFVGHVEKVVGSEGLNLLVNNAGIMRKGFTLETETREVLRENLEVNTIAPLFVTQSLLPLLKVAAGKHKGKDMNIQRAAIVSISSTLASIEGNKLGGYYSYRASKSALNSLSRSMSMDLKSQGIMTAVIHPGWVKTDMGGDKAPMTPKQSASGIIGTLKGLTQEHSGAFLNFNGKILPY